MDSVGMTTGTLRFDLAIEADPRFISPIRRFVEDALERILGDADAVFRVALTVHELMENAAKYATDRQATLRVKVEPHGAGARVAVSVTNRTTAEHVRRLRKVVAQIHAATDSLALYHAAMRRSTRSSAESGLGLVRIHAEGEMDLGLDVLDRQEVTLTATALLDPGGES